ncbi:MAG: hypothetical protein OXF11_07360 [Deltaproteobacteria bacterium]|nr:hypothetical protein [Deltaproteobacteria bacterium]
MALDPATTSSTFDRYIEELRALWKDSNDANLPFKVQAAMERMLASTSPDDPWIAEIIRDAQPSRELYRDPEYGFVQMGHVHPQGHGNLPHDHGPCWVVYGAYQGLTEISLYERVDDGKNAEKADMHTKEVHKLGPGVVYPYLTGQIHSTHAAETPAVVFRFLSADLTKILRRRYNLESGEVSLIEPQP